MTCRKLIGTVVAVAGLVGWAAISPSSAGAQLSLPTFTNSSSADEAVAGTATTPSHERETNVELLSSPAGAFTTRFSSLVSDDGDSPTSAAGLEFLAADYEIDFTATAPGAYRLTVQTTASGDMHLVNDGTGSASADMGGITGVSGGGTFESGSLDIADPGSISGSGGGDIGISDGSTATIFGVSNGSPVPHSLHFVFTQQASTSASNGDDAAVRFGISSSIGTETAGDYPGSPARTQSDDGHFVTVTITSLCGNGVIDTGPSYTEQCDDGANNGHPELGSCCTTTCTFAADSTPCDDGDQCTSGTQCQSGACTGGSAVVCPPCQTCDPLQNCIDGPRPTCRQVTATNAAKFQIKNRTPDTGDQVTFKWTKGEDTQLTDFGHPLTTDNYAICVFEPSLQYELVVPPGGTCGTQPCWKQQSIKGFSFKDSLGSNDGVTKISLKAGIVGKSKVQLKGKGTNLHTGPFPNLPLPLTLPARVQLQSGNGTCWEATFKSTGMSENDANGFNGKGGQP
jgi:hypothetical protein